MPKVVIYTTLGCPYCANAKELLTKKGVKYEEVQVDKDANKLAEMVKLSNRRSVPQIFINNKSIGGFDDLSKLAASGELDTLLKDE
ncbi:glutaredoxin [Candidatus Rickettsiella isopodorum]|jgi:glutaredoxin 3|uniref:Glutaredoxin n=1 Tax=Candidatus Rickettsiella isopodorum TaxID=1225476 RepID=A0A1J8P3Q5_9COXI|nr:glutaredoxin 3 [Candidatus Rickettsiella isopodorum]MCH9637180.1 glutaredoxin 3 [Gammaproteobacteria bacterium]MDQ5899602.1 glutaredoxin 3 [Pseudomonadota bacterium]MCH9754584.1 glutaredoxin 3 [Gammaproteobacteria bacterium]MDD4893103.1 glutaredoxin 3 [Candidatus Rickettsiella isopodorum]MDD5161498.1 glutaredoxin 3 [Candidatus Rickettsiella isopodorum]